MSFNEEFAPSALPVFYRTYSRGKTESWTDVVERTIQGLVELGKLTDEEAALIKEQQEKLACLPSGRWLWVGGTEWLKKPENVYGSYNCSSTNIIDWESFRLMMSLAMQGTGTGAVLEQKYIDKLPVIRNKLEITIAENIGEKSPEHRIEKTEIFEIVSEADKESCAITVGDSREGWVKSYQTILELSSDESSAKEITVNIYLGNIRPAGEKLKGFGGTANPEKLTAFYGKIANILNKAIGRKLTAKECCLIIDEAALVVVAGNVRRSAGIRQGQSDDAEFASTKDNLWQQSEDGKWQIDPERDALRMANHTRVFHHRPSLEELKAAVTKQYYSGEGAIQWAGEAVARANADLLNTVEKKKAFLSLYDATNGDAWGAAGHYLETLNPDMKLEELEHRMSRYGLNPCGK